ncbi:MAG TPA: glycosyltransferase family 2 protein [Candidatus Sulfotelmatobacter sp.]|nr:glycosyltransferase family 2 protein [Candidatus Sulfotelmatobacter sp.]
MQLAIVIPVYNSAGTIGALVDQLCLTLSAQSLHVVLVNDGSTDASDRVCRELSARHAGTVTYARLARNFGEHNAVMAGLHHARGDYVVIMDDDFQQPPEEAARLLAYASAHAYDIVYTRYAHKHHPWLRNLGSWLNDRLATVLLDKPRDLYLSSFKCLSRFVIDHILTYRGPYPYIDGLALRCTRNIGVLPVRHAPRRDGRSQYTLRRLLHLWLNMFVNFSVMPLRLSTLLGLAGSALGLLLGLEVVAERLLRPDVPVGWASVLVVILLFAGIQLVMLGVIGEYLGRLFLTENQTPQFVIREIVEMSSPPGGEEPMPTAAPASAGAPDSAHA